MKMKALFSLPEGQKVTEKQLHRVLLTSICSILLCMSCLAGVTWAWFSASIENTNNVIWIAEPGVVLKIGETTYKGETLSDAECAVRIEHGNERDVFEQKSTLYVVVSVQSGEKVIQAYTILNEVNQYVEKITIVNDTKAEFTIRAKAYWSVPENVDPIGDEHTIQITAGDIPDKETESTNPPMTDPIEPETTNPNGNAGIGEGNEMGNGTGDKDGVEGDETTTETNPEDPTNLISGEGNEEISS